ncbi:MAG: DUF4272 domain-containing protein [Anaerolineae bacterium]
MSDTIAILAPSEERVPIDELHELTAIDEIVIVRDLDDHITAYRIEWEDVQLTIRFPDDDSQETGIAEFLSTVDDLLDNRRDKKAKKIWRRAERMTQYISCEVTPDWDEARKAQLLVQGVMAYYDYALMFAGGAIYNENGNIEVGAEQHKRKYWEEPAEKAEQDTPNERKKASLQILNRERVPQIKHLRNLPDDDQFTLRPLQEVVQRAIALNLISRRADGESREWFEQKVAQYQLADAITEQERIFNEDDAPDDYVVIMFSQRLEACWLLLWALSLLPELARPDSFANADRAHEIIDSRSLDQFLIEARLRDKAEILDALDLHFRYHWAVVDAELYGKKSPTGLHPDVVYQRHYALNWLTQLRDQDWDSITTDT